MPRIISLVIIQAIFSFIFFPLTYSDNNVIQTTCRKTPFVNLCVSTLKSDPRSADANVRGLAHIMANTVSAKASATLIKIKGLLKSAQDPNLQKELQSCVSLYNLFIQDDIRIASNAIDKDPKFTVDYATDAAKCADLCEKSFANPPKSPIYDENKNVHDLSTVFSSIASLLL